MDGLLGNPQDSGLHGLGQNPLFRMGMGLLASRYDSRINPYQSILAGVDDAVQMQNLQKDRELRDKLRKDLQALITGTARAPGVGAPGYRQYGDFDRYMRNQMLIDQLTGGGQ